MDHEFLVSTLNENTQQGVPPDPPHSLTAQADGSSSIKLSWEAPTINASIISYRIQASPDGNTGWTRIATVVRTFTTYEDTGLDPCTTKYYRVISRAFNESSSPSNVAQATTSGCATVPDAPTSLTATASGQNAIMLSWTAPASDGGAAISGYQVVTSADGGTNYSQIVTGWGSTSITHSGLPAGSARHYRVRAINSEGYSAWSNTANATTDAATVTFPDPPTSLTATASGQTIINLSWTAPASNGGAAISGYRIDVSTDGGTNFSQLAASHSTTSYSHTGLTAGTARHYRVRAKNSVGNSAWSNTANATTDAATATFPDAPTSLTATASGQTIINLSWTAPASDGGAAISGYRIDVSTNGGSSFSQLVASHSTTSYSHTGLTAGSARHYRVRAINSVGNSGWSNTANATTATPTATIPDAPTSLTATASGETTIDLSWTAPVNTGGVTLTGYRLEWSPNGNDSWEELSRTTATSDSHTGLTQGIPYYYRVYAINSVGDSPPSNVADATITPETSTSVEVSFDQTSSQVNEATATATIELNANPAPSSAITIAYSLGGTATQTADYTIQGSGSISLAANMTSVNLSIEIINDDEDESDETLSVTLTSGVGYTIGSQNVHTLTIVDDDDDTDVVPLSFANSAENHSFFVGIPIDDVVLSKAVGGTPPYRYRLTRDLPAGLTYDGATQTISGTPSESLPETVFIHRVTDAADNSAIQTFLIEVIAPKDLIFVGSVDDQIYPINQPISDLVLPSAMGGVEPYLYSIIPDPPRGISFDAEAHTLSGTPLEVTESQLYTYTVEDRAQATSQLEIRMEVYTITFSQTVANQSYSRDQAIDPLTLPAVIGGVPPIEYTLKELPTGLQFDGLTRMIMGTPTEIIPLTSLTYKAVDDNGAQDSLRFSIEVVSPVHTQQNAAIPQQFRGYSNYPNPFRTSTNLVFDLPWPAQVQVDVTDMTGRRLVATPSVYLSAGWGQEIELSELRLPSGPYLYRIQATSLDQKSSTVYFGHFISVH